MPANRKSRPKRRPPKPPPAIDHNRYVVVGNRKIHGHAPGEELTNLDAKQAERLLAVGSIELADTSADRHQYVEPVVDLDEAGHDAIAENPTEER